MMKPIVLLGDTGKLEFIKRITEEKFGMMFTERKPRIHYTGMPWAFDNGCFGAWRNETAWDLTAWQIRIDRVAKMDIHPPLFAVVPDLPARGAESLLFSRDRVELVPARFPKALALQDGMRYQDVKKDLAHYDYLFIGGSDAFKLHARDWVRFARDNGKFIHYARASTLEKLEYAIHCEVDSLDSSFPTMDSAEVPSVRGYFCERASQLCPIPSLRDGKEGK
jgi:hypothetical protein